MVGFRYVTPSCTLTHSPKLAPFITPPLTGTLRLERIFHVHIHDIHIHTGNLRVDTYNDGAFI